MGRRTGKETHLTPRPGSFLQPRSHGSPVLRIDHTRKGSTGDVRRLVKKETNPSYYLRLV